jgi:anti-sigma-K factor RskA
MIDETTQDLAALHALDLLPEPERSAFARRLETEPGLRRLVDQLREAAVAPALAAPARAPSPALRARVLASIATCATPNARVIPFPAWLGWTSLAAAAALALVATRLHLDGSRLAGQATLATQATRLLDAELRATRNQLEAERLLAAAQNQQWKLADAETARLRADLETDRRAALARIAALESRNRLAELRIASLSALAGQPTSAQGVAVWDSVTQQGVLTVSKLPALASDRDYQLWLVDPQYPTPVDGGVFRVDPATGEARIVFKADKPVRDASAFAISLERKGGVPVAEGPMILAGK